MSPKAFKECHHGAGGRRLPPETYAHYWGGGKKRRKPGYLSLLREINIREVTNGYQSTQAITNRRGGD